MINNRIERGIEVIEFNRADKKNAFTGAMYDLLSDSLAQADSNDLVSVIVLTGAGNAFSAGNDLEDFIKSPPENADAPPFQFLKTLSQVKKPVVAAVNGMAVGIGATMLLHCDLVFAQESARFIFPFVSLGLVPEGASSLLLPHLVGHQKASEILLLGEPMSATDAKAAGIVNRVVEGQPVLEYAVAQAARLTQLPAGAILSTKALLKHGPEVMERINLEAEVFVERTKSSAAKEAFSAFAEKRKPNFTGLN